MTNHTKNGSTTTKLRLPSYVNDFRFPWRICFLISFLSLLSSVKADISESTGPKTGRFYTNEWAVRIVNGTVEDAQRMANKHGYEFVGQVIKDYFLFRDNRGKSRSVRRSRSLSSTSLSRDPDVSWMQQQVAKKRVKRDYKYNDHPHAFVQRRIDSQPNYRLIHDDIFHKNNEVGGQSYRKTYGTPDDPYWKDMWYLHRSDESGLLDHNVREAWDLGYTGKGVVVTILDDGLERSHPDLAPNYVSNSIYITLIIHSLFIKMF